MPVLLQHGASAGRRTIEERLSGPVFDDLIVIVPTRRRIRYLVREVMTATGRPVTPAFPFYTLELFVRELSEASPRSRRIVAGPVQSLLFDDAIRRSAGSLEYFRGHDRGGRIFRGTFDRISETILHLKESGITAVRLFAEAEEAPLDERLKLRDIAAVYAAYEERLASLEATDVPGVLLGCVRDASPREFAETFRSLFPRAELLSLAGFDEFTEPEIDLLRLLIGIPGLAVRLLFDFEPGNPALFGHLESNYRRFRDLGFVPMRDDAPIRRIFPINTISRSPETGKALDQIARRLFLSTHPADRMDLRSSVTVAGAAGRREEVRGICRLIKHLLVSEPGLDPASICVAMLRPQLYTDLFREESRRTGIPANITDRYGLSRSPVIINILGLLRLPVSGFLRNDVLRIAGAPHFTFRALPIDPANLAMISGRLRITGGSTTWRDRLERRRQQIEGSAADERELRSILAAQKDIEAIADAVSELGSPATPAQFVARLERMLKRLELRRNLVSLPDAKLAERDVRAFSTFLDALHEMAALLEFQFGAEETHPLRFYCEHLATAVLRERYNVREEFGAGVLITSIDETRGLPMRVMILAGCVDGEFPEPYQTEVFLSAERRRERERRAIWQNRYLFYQAVTNWSDHCYLTFPRSEGGKDLVPSSFIDSLRSVIRMEEWESFDAAPWAEGVFSGEELVAWAMAHPGTPLPAADPGFDAALGQLRLAAAVERGRASGRAHSAHQGIIAAPLSPLAARRLESQREQAFSITVLESYGSCPFQYFADRLLELRPAEELEEELTALERGSLLHEALFEFFVARRESRKPVLAGCSDAEFRAALAELTLLVEGKLAEFDIPDPFWHIDRELLLKGGGIRTGLLEEFLRYERKREVTTAPAFFEVSFGRTGPGRRDPLLHQEEPLALGTLRLSGKIDRIDVGEGCFSVLDYKSGSGHPSFAEIAEGTSLQIPFYLLAAEILLRKGGRDLAPAAGFTYHLKPPVRASLALGSRSHKEGAIPGAPTRALLENDAALRAVCEQSVAFAEGYVREMAGGRFPLTTPEKGRDVCRHCAFGASCRVRSVRSVESEESEEA